MKIEEIITSMPDFAALIGEEWLSRKRNWAEEFIGERLPWYEQLDRDIGILSKYLDNEKLVSCYRDSLRNQPQIQKTIFEIHGAALMASVAAKIDLHVPLVDGSGRNYDIWAEIGGYPVNAEFKTRKDEFPFNLPREPGPASDIPGGVRETMDPHDAADLGINLRKPVDGLHHISTPESTRIRQILLDGLGQLPVTGYNFVIFGHIEGDRRNLKDALYGTELIERRVDRENRKVIFRWKRAPTGAFDRGSAGEPFRGINGVLWIRLMPFAPDGDVLGRAYKLYLNPCSTSLPEKVKESLNAAIDQWTTMREEKLEESNE
jgi:hypothetical protein